jgi:predicted RNA-binding Zn ribbon-like protein
VLENPATPQDLDRTQNALEAWEKVVDATDEHERAELLNRMLATAAAYPRMTNHSGSGWHLHFRDDQQSLGSILFSLIAVGTALHLTGRGMHRLRRCAVSECTTIFADTSRTGRQRYCTQRCANRDAVRRHRARTTPPVP